MPNYFFLFVNILVKATKTHCYYTMKNFGDGDEATFLAALLNIIPHYQVSDTLLRYGLHYMAKLRYFW